jgi:molecular chaperone DnaJ
LVAAPGKRDYYEILDVPKDATADVIKRAYRKLTRKYHPDTNPGDADAERKFKEINEANDVLSDPKKRAQYDQFGYVGDAPPPGAGGFGGDFFGGGGGGFNGDLFGDIFENLFGGASSRGGNPNAPRRGSDLEMTMRITLETAYRGETRDVDVPREENCPHCDASGAEPGSKVTVCSACGGRGQVERVANTSFGRMVQVVPCAACGGRGKIIETPCKECRGAKRVRKSHKLEVRIPPGVETGTRLRISGEGEAGRNGGPAGDLYILLDVASDPRFQREGADLHARIEIEIPQAVLGVSVSIPMFEGAEKLEVPAGTQPGSLLRIKNRGMPKLRGSGNGDLLVHVKVNVPKNLSVRGKQIISELASEMKVEVADNKGIFDRIRDKLSG